MGTVLCGLHLVALLNAMMKLFVLAALVAVAAGARLEGLERAYLPPNGPQGSNELTSPGGVQNGNNGFGTAGNSQSPTQGSEGSGFGPATSNQYLPPDHGPSNGFNFGGSSFRPGSNFGSSPQGAQYNQFGFPNRQYLAPQTSSQNPPLQAFDEQTGYHY